MDIHQFHCVSPLEIPVDNAGRFAPDGKVTKQNKFAVGNLAGIEMAFQNCKDQGFDYLRPGDYVTFLCTEVQPSMQPGFSDMPLFAIAISDKPPQIPQPEPQPQAQPATQTV